MTTQAMERTDEATAVVVGFLEALERGDLDGAAGLLAEDAVWINVSLPPIRSRERIVATSRVFMQRLGVGFRVHLRHVARDGDVVLTEREDALTFGRLEQRFWVHGRFEVVDGRIRVWRDAFDWGDMTVGLVRGLAGVVHPKLNRPWPRPA